MRARARRRGLGEEERARTRASRITNLRFFLAVQSTVKTSFSRPPSKPRVRNPLTLLKSHGQGHGISPPLSSTGCPIPNIGTNHRSTDSPTQLEKDFLAMGGSDTTHLAPSGWGEGSMEEDFFALIPEDTAHLNSSLSTSLASICREQLDAQGSEVNT